MSKSEKRLELIQVLPPCLQNMPHWPIKPKHVFEGKFTDAVCELRHLDELVLRDYYVAINELARKKPSPHFSSRSAWIFMHPTFEVFKEFLFDDLILESFCTLIYLVQKARKSKGGMSFSKRRIKKDPNFGTLMALANQYSALIGAHFGATHEYVHQTRSNSKRVLMLKVTRLRNREQAYKNARSAVVDGIKERISRESRRISALNQELVSMYAGLYPVDGNYSLWKSSGVIPDWVGEQLKINWGKARLDRHTPKDCKPIAALNTYLMRIVTRGMWPVTEFGEVEQYCTVCYPDATDNSLELIAKSPVLHSLNKVAQRLKKTNHDLLTVGAKLHFLQPVPPEGLQDLKLSFFQLERACKTVILPAVGNVEAMLEILERCEEKIKVPVFDAPRQCEVQVCSPGRISPEGAAYLGAAFVMGSHHFRSPKNTHLRTTHEGITGEKLVIYGAGALNGDFPWRHASGASLTMTSVFKTGRTDVLTCLSAQDIVNVNLIATLLVHDQYRGRLADLGREFKTELRRILSRYSLQSALSAPWVHVFDPETKPSVTFPEAFELLSAHMQRERELFNMGMLRGSAMLEVQGLIQYCLDEVKGAQ